MIFAKKQKVDNILRQVGEKKFHQAGFSQTNLYFFWSMASYIHAKFQKNPQSGFEENYNGRTDGRTHGHRDGLTNMSNY